MDEKQPLDMFVITKSLSDVINPQSIAHKVLADRIAFRDPGNKPKPNDRIPMLILLSIKDVLLRWIF